MVEGLVERYREAVVTVVRQSVIVDAPPDEVWRVIADPRNLPRWNSHIRDVFDVPDHELGPGDRYGIELRIMRVPIRIRAEVAEVQPRRYSEVLLSGPVDATVRTYVRPIGTHRTRLEHEVHYRFAGGPLGELVARGVKFLGAGTIIKRGLKAQKVQVEGV